MASDQGLVPSAAPVLSRALPETAPQQSTATPSGIDAVALKSLKRSRAEQSQNSDPSSFADVGLTVSPLAKSPRFGGALSPRFSPAPLTGAAAMEDQRQRRQEQERARSAEMSENPSYKIISSLISGGASGMSKPQDAPAAATSMSEGLASAAKDISIPSPMQFDDKSEVSPASVTSLASLGSTAQTATASTTGIASPTTMLGPNESEQRDQNPLSSEKPSTRAFTFPGNVLSRPDSGREQSRGMSLPMSGLNQQIAPRSPSHKKHKCPYCETEFTRHHNLKSHLLTHSQEKPYVCQNCQMRFRRLHDLKRHTKLHTGERPHICPKCDRKFARGDALARHSKGQGGCAGRRASMGSFGEGDDYDESHAGDDSGMDGIMYTEDPENRDGEMDDERRFSLPSIKAQHVGSSQDYPQQARAPSTYPPSGPRPRQPLSGNYQQERGSTSTAASTSLQSSRGGHSTNQSISTSHGGPSVFSHNPMTESPRPLSPGAMAQHQIGHESGSLNRQRSPSLATQLQQQNFGRRASERSSPQGISLPSPHGGPKLPAISGLAPPEPRYTLPSQVPAHQASTNGAPPTQHAQQLHQGTTPNFQPQMTQPNSGRPLHQGSGSGDSTNNMFASDRGIWVYIQNLEEKVKQLSDKVIHMETVERAHEDKIGQLSEEVLGLRNQLGAKQQHRSGPSYSGQHTQQQQ